MREKKKKGMRKEIDISQRCKWRKTAMCCQFLNRLREMSEKKRTQLGDAAPFMEGGEERGKRRKRGDETEYSWSRNDLVGSWGVDGGGYKGFLNEEKGRRRGDLLKLIGKAIGSQTIGRVGWEGRRITTGTN